MKAITSAEAEVTNFVRFLPFGAAYDRYCAVVVTLP